MVIWGDDQYENFKEDVVPPFCVLAYDVARAQPWEYHRGPNVWGEPEELSFDYKGHRGGREIHRGGMLEAGFDVAYAYKPLHHELGHAFLNTLLYLDYDRKGFPYPVVPFQVNCYGRRSSRSTAGARGLTSSRRGRARPPRPRPVALLRLGAACARALAEQPVAGGADRIVELVARLPDPEEPPALSRCEADRALYDALQAGGLRDAGASAR